MKTKRSIPSLFLIGYVVLNLLTACAPGANQAANTTEKPMRVLAVESFLADIAQNVAGKRVQVESLMPLGMDPHAYEPTPADVAKITEADLIIVNGSGFEEWLQETLDSAGGKHTVIEASTGLSMRTPPIGEHPQGDVHHEGDPHFWLNPLNAIAYVENIRSGLVKADPDGEAIYTQNSSAYTQQLKDLDQWIKTQVDQIPSDRRLLVTNHESLGYFADRYGFKIIGTIIPSASTSAAPSAQQLAALVDSIKASHAPAIFLETGSNPALAEQAAQDAGVTLVSQLYTHSLTEADGAAPTYIAMMKYNTREIVERLK